MSSSLLFEQKKELIFGYPPIIYTLNENEDANKSLWRHLGKHIYGNCGNDMQIKHMLEEHD